MSNPPKRKADARPTLTLKGDGFTAEFRALLNKAAKRKGMTQAAFVAEVLDREARKVLQGVTDNMADTPPPPAVLEKVAETDKRVAELADQVRLLTQLQQRTLWQKLRGAFV
jgi:uncharacterized protein (DUF1778 family)